MVVYPVGEALLGRLLAGRDLRQRGDRGAAQERVALPAAIRGDDYGLFAAPDFMRRGGQAGGLPFSGGQRRVRTPDRTEGRGDCGAEGSRGATRHRGGMDRALRAGGAGRRTGALRTIRRAAPEILRGAGVQPRAGQVCRDLARRDPPQAGGAAQAAQRGGAAGERGPFPRTGGIRPRPDLYPDRQEIRLPQRGGGGGFRRRRARRPARHIDFGALSSRLPGAGRPTHPDFETTNTAKWR